VNPKKSDPAEVEQKVRDLLARKTGMPATEPERAFKSLPAWDSLRHAEFIIALQSEFKIRFSPSQIAQLENLQGAVKVVRQALGI